MELRLLKMRTFVEDKSDLNELIERESKVRSKDFERPLRLRIFGPTVGSEFYRVDPGEIIALRLPVRSIVSSRAWSALDARFALTNSPHFQLCRTAHCADIRLLCPRPFDS